jgi:hypothetical protein
MPEKHRLPPAVEWVRIAIQGRIKAGDWVMDATAGNGHDTLFLSSLVGTGGRIFAFDIQPEAIEATRRLLDQNKVEASTYSLLLESHARAREVLPPAALGRIACVMFNLGFLPGGDKQLTTKAHSTIEGLCAATELLARGGMLCVVAYPGHESGKDEAEQVERWMSALSPSHFEVQNVRAVNRLKPAPELWLALRI